MKTIGIIGCGEIGCALEKCYTEFGDKFKVGVVDTGFEINSLYFNPQILNICIPFNDKFDFIQVVSNYIKKYSPELTIIHSTVRPGTTKQIIEQSGNKNVVHSPCRGVHPHLYEGLKTFVKFVGGDPDVTNKAKSHLEELGIKSNSFGDSVATELAKLLDTTYYGLCIAFHNDINNLCKTYAVKYDEVATKWNTTYNEGYQSLGKDNVVRPVLYPPVDGKIGGHCIIPNAEILKQIYPSFLVDYILNLK